MLLAKYFSDIENIAILAKLIRLGFLVNKIFLFIIAI